MNAITSVLTGFITEAREMTEAAQRREWGNNTTRNYLRWLLNVPERLFCALCLDPFGLCIHEPGNPLSSLKGFVYEAFDMTRAALQRDWGDNTANNYQAWLRDWASRLKDFLLE